MLHPIEDFQILPGNGLRIDTALHQHWFFRHANGWQYYQLLQGAVKDNPIMKLTDVTEPPADFHDSQQINSGEQESTLRIVPAMLNRNILLKPAQRLIVPGNRKPKLYVALPMMYQVFLGQQKKPVLEFCCEPLAKLWFGTNTRKGELCYQSQQQLVSDPLHLQEQPHRVYLELRIQNRDSDSLVVEKLNIPVAYLPIYRINYRQFWTAPLTISKERLSEELRLNYGKGVPIRHDHQQLISDAKYSSESRTFMRALEAIIG